MLEKKNTEALLMVVEIWSLGILDRKARVDLLPYRKIKVFGNKIQHFEQDTICLKLIPFFGRGGGGYCVLLIIITFFLVAMIAMTIIISVITWIIDYTSILNW